MQRLKVATGTRDRNSHSGLFLTSFERQSSSAVNITSSTWQWITRGSDLYKDGFTLQGVLDRIDADVVQVARSKVTQSHRRCRIGEVQLCAFTFY